MLPGSVIELIRSAPHNDTVRAVVLAHLKQPIPPEHVTYDAIKQWVEATIEAPKAKKSQLEDILDGIVARPNTPAVRNTINIPIRGSDTESGTAMYTVRRNGRAHYEISVRDFMTMVDAAGSLDEFCSAMDEFIAEDWEESVELNDNREYDYTNHEPDSDEPHTGSEWDYDCNIRALLRQLLAQHAPNSTLL